MTAANPFGRTHIRPAAQRRRIANGRPGLRRVAAWAGKQASDAGAVLRGIADGIQAYRRWRDLNMMGDGELARLGIERREIVRHAMLGPDIGFTQP